MPLWDLYILLDAVINSIDADSGIRKSSLMLLLLKTTFVPFPNISEYQNQPLTILSIVSDEDIQKLQHVTSDNTLRAALDIIDHESGRFYHLF